MQDVATAGTFVDDLKGKKATVFAQDNAFGQGNLAAVKAALGAKGAMADAILVPEDVTEFTPFARQLIHTKPACRHHEVTAAQGLEPCGPEPSGRTASATLSLSRAPVIAATPRSAVRNDDEHTPPRSACPARRRPADRWARAGLGRTFQTSSLFTVLSVEENVRIAANALEEVELQHKAGARAGDLSHGDKRKVEIALLLATSPSVILLDEPMAGVGSGDVPGSRAHRADGRTPHGSDLGAG